MTPSAARPATSRFPHWRAFPCLSFYEAAFVAAHCPGDPWAMYVSCVPGRTSFAVAHEETPNRWRWSLFSAAGDMLDDGWENTLDDARRVAQEARRLWVHRCEVRDQCRCGGDSE